ncbi:MAG: VCBS repeat-containing protein, partial [Acidobacteriota bacterium]
MFVSPASTDHRVTFTDITQSSGVTFKHVFSADKKYILESMSGGVALIDYDNDGWLDIYFVNSPTVETAANPKSARSELWRNKGDGTFADVTDKTGVGFPGFGMGVCAGDFDNDGWEDLYVTCFGANRLYRNQGAKGGEVIFTDVAAKAGVTDPRWSTGAAFGDYNNDGLLDLFVANYVDLKPDALPEFGKGKHCSFQGLPVQCGPQGLRGAGDSLFRNNGDGTFTDVTAGSGLG